MRLTPDAATLWMRGLPHWRRCAFDGVALLGDDLVLAADPTAPAPAWPVAPAQRWTGMAFDTRCRLFRAMPQAGATDAEPLADLAYVIWGQTSALGVHNATVHPLHLSGMGTEGAGDPGEVPQHLVAVGVDAHDLLYATDPVRRAVWVIDPWQREVSRRIEFTAIPLDVATCGDAVFVLTDDGQVWQLSACEAPQAMPWPRRAGAVRLTVSRAVQALDAGAQAMGAGPWLAWVLVNPGAALSRVHALHNGSAVTVADALDLVSGDDDARLGTPLTLAMTPGQDFVQLRWLGAQPTVQGAGLSAPGYDDTGIALAPDGRVAYWSPGGLRHASPARARYRTRGQVLGFALDSGHDQRSWGAVRVQACVPQGTELRVWMVTRDELDHTDPVPHTAPVGALPDFTDVPEPERTPLVSSLSWALQLTQTPQGHALYRDTHQPRLLDAPDEGMQWFEVPVMAPPGRYLWVMLELRGTRHKSPKVRAVQVQHPGHRWLQQLPRTLWHEPASRDFLHRYLMPLARLLDDWDRSAAERHRLLDPRITPAEALPWLGRFVGLAMDPCWPEAVQRQLVGEAARLFRTRGTVASLKRMIGILVGDAEVVLLEHYRLRGGGVMGNEAARESQAVLGAGFRVGGLIGEPNTRPLADTEPVRFDDFAHRFTVVIATVLTEAQRACVERLIELHKPAHTAFTLCTVQGGLRLGLGSHLGVATVVGASGGFQPAITGEAALGQGFILGRPELDAPATPGTTGTHEAGADFAPHPEEPIA
ncbi:phage tail protein [Aquabacterium sp. A3]|uniref:phage tail protein n=1 Tax=Aquabacterium sp. A3 TaxID=3132829 RepID=UPI00311A1F57